MNRHPFVILVPLVVVVLVAAVAFGSVPLGVGELIDAIRSPDADAAPIVRTLRAPRVLLAFLVGGSLAVSGAALQALVRNPLADPYLLGLSGGAGLGAVVAIALALQWAWAIPAAAAVGSLAAVALVYRLSVVAGGRIDPRVLILAGVVVGSFASALMSAIMTLSGEAELRNAFLWLLGGFGGASWAALLLFAGYATLPLGVLVLSARTLDLLTLGEETAQHLGADLERAKRIIYVTTSLLVAASVAVSGIIGFVGLVVPHAARRLWTPLHRPLLPVVFLLGGAFLVLADLLARTVVRPLELPVGVVTALVGVPLFAVLLRRSMA